MMMQFALRDPIWASACASDDEAIMWVASRSQCASCN